MEKQRMVLRQDGEFMSAWTEQSTMSIDVLQAIYSDATVTVSKPSVSDPCGHMYGSVVTINY